MYKWPKFALPELQCRICSSVTALKCSYGPYKLDTWSRNVHSMSTSQTVTSQNIHFVYGSLRGQTLRGRKEEFAQQTIRLRSNIANKYFADGHFTWKNEKSLWNYNKYFKKNNIKKREFFRAKNKRNYGII